MISICIPTYNREASLYRLLAILIPQCKGLNVEIIISDNGSSDGTEQICLELGKNLDMLHYLKHKSNLGFAENLVTVLKAGTGQYLWMLGDDEILQNNALERIVTTLAREQPSWLLCNFAKVINLNDPLEIKGQFKLSFDLSRVSLDEVLLVVGAWSSFMSINIVSQQAFRDWLSEHVIIKSDYIGFDICLHAGLLGNNYILSEPLIWRQVFPLETHRFDRLNTYVLEFFAPLDRLVQDGHITLATRNKLASEMFFGIIGLMFLKARINNYKIPSLRIVASQHWRCFSYWVLILPIVITPRFILVGLVFALKRLLSYFTSSKAQKLSSYLNN